MTPAEPPVTPRVFSATVGRCSSHRNMCFLVSQAKNLGDSVYSSGFSDRHRAFGSAAAPY